MQFCLFDSFLVLVLILISPRFVFMFLCAFPLFVIPPCPLTQVAALMEYGNVDDYFDKKSDEQVKKELEFACKKFPSITLGYSRPVELYSKNKSSEETRISENNFLPTPTHVGWLDPDSLSGTFPPEILNFDSSNLRDETSDGSSFTSQTPTPEVETTSDDSAAHRFLDSSIGSMPGLSKRHSNQLDSCGFHTVGILKYN